ncbi:hypothetical protein ABIB25_003422 [Nakamurella sp. UYEF19]|uniref:hypothetical protein n=1 Tax=Nakamurella sp. UYEF19 TaxID=1756392 RepID=UPI003399B4D2
MRLVADIACGGLSGDGSTSSATFTGTAPGRGRVAADTMGPVGGAFATGACVDDRATTDPDAAVRTTGVAEVSAEPDGEVVRDGPAAVSDPSAVTSDRVAMARDGAAVVSDGAAVVSDGAAVVSDCAAGCPGGVATVFDRAAAVGAERGGTRGAGAGFGAGARDAAPASSGGGDSVSTTSSVVASVAAPSGHALRIGGTTASAGAGWPGFGVSTGSELIGTPPSNGPVG